MIKKTLSLILSAVIALFAYDTSAQTNAETVNVTEPGTLRDLVNAVPSARINHLTIEGTLNGKDIAYLVGGTGKMVSIDTLDISKITLIGDDEPYNQFVVDRSFDVIGSTTAIFYLSERDTIISDRQNTAIGGYVEVQEIYGKDLSGAFGNNKSFKHIIMPKHFTKIGRYQFYNNTSICSVEFPKYMTAMEIGAFYGASALKTISIPTGIATIPKKSLSRCESLETVVLSGSVDSICDYGFWETPIQNINLKNVRHIGEAAFDGNKLTGLLDISSLERMGKRAFYGENTISGILFSTQLTDIPDNAFCQAGLTSLELPSNVVRVGKSAFSSCKNLRNVTLSPNIVSISSDSFYNTPWQKNLKGEAGVIYVGTVALAYDSSTAPKGNTFSFREGTTTIANSSQYSHFLNDRYEKVILPESLIRIGSRVFDGCTSLTEIKLPEGLREIGPYAFSRCEGLSSIDIPEGITEIQEGTFNKCKGLQEMKFPQNLIKIGKSAFAEDSKMYFFELPSSLNVIGSEAFYGCTSIPSVTLPENLDSIHGYAFRDCTGIESIRINSKELKVADYIFGSGQLNKSNLYQVTVAPSVSVLPSKMFQDCSTLQKIIFEEIESSALKKIGDGCFYQCSNLPIYELPCALDSIGAQAFFRTAGYQGKLNTGKLKYIGSCAFEENNDLTELVITTPQIFLGGASFADCPNLTKVTIESEIIDCDGTPFRYGLYGKGSVRKVEVGTKIQCLPEQLFYGVKIDTLIFHKRDVTTPLELGDWAFCMSNIPGSLILPEGTVKIGKEAFSYCMLNKVVIPNMCKEIGNSAFAHNKWLYNLSLGEGVEVIGQSAFYECEELESIVIPATCREIGGWFIQYCKALKSIYFNSETPPVFKDEIESSSGNINKNLTIYVPYNSLDKYKKIPQLKVYNIQANPSTIIDVESIMLSPDSWSVEKGKSFTIEAAVFPENAVNKTLEWSSSDETIAKVGSRANSQCKVTTYKIGEATITAKATDGSGVSASCKVTVLPILVESIQLTPDNWNGVEGDSFSIIAAVKPPKATNTNVLWSSSDESIATVDTEGNVSVHKEGTCVITATAEDGSGATAECVITSVSGIEEIFSDAELLDIFDANGTMIRKGCELEDLKCLTPGIYIIRCGAETKKFIIH